ncbi:hypothetical protein [Pelagibius sp. Alg239-R121]|uniref:hypothetical protein n=1 Tax=Pelagibius sp. Alg239-R121 TaxID=2993448 RepID=UPI0024A61B6D|nr:hypothetical protein [Pelagibius sp. Alg239-R121]
MPEIFVHKSGVMRHIIAAISKGYIYHTTGRVPFEKAERLFTKFEEKYSVNPDRVEAQKRKRHGEANARLFLYPGSDSLTYDFWFLLTEGEHPALSEEKLRRADHKRSRILFQDQYEAICLPAASSVPRWTWRLTQKQYRGYEEWIENTIRHAKDDSEAKAVIRSLQSLPGFRGIRQQVFALRKHFIREWGRIKGEEACPITDRMQGYLRYQSYKTVPIELVNARMAEGLKPISDAWRKTERKPKTKILAEEKEDDMSVSIAPPVKSENVTMKKVVFTSKSFAKLESYRAAFEEKHSTTITNEELIPLLVEFAFDKDPEFKKHLRQQGKG